jgi:hypothetical protein
MTSAAAKQALDFNGWVEQDVLLSSIIEKFDVRIKSAESDAEAVKELTLSGPKSRRPPYITVDYVQVDGRHEILRHREANPAAGTTIRCRILPFAFEDLNADQRAEVRAWAIEQNLPDPTQGPRVFETTDDIAMNIGIYLEEGRTEAEIRKLLHKVPKDQLNAAYRSAFESFKQKNLYRVEQLRKRDDLKPSETAKLLPMILRKDYLKSPKGRGEASPPASDKAGFLAIKKCQTALDKAVDAMGRYGDQLLEKYLAEKPGYTAKTIRRTLEYHASTAVRLQGKVTRMRAKIEAAITEREAKGRGPNRY